MKYSMRHGYRMFVFVTKYFWFVHSAASRFEGGAFGDLLPIGGTVRQEFVGVLAVLIAKRMAIPTRTLKGQRALSLLSTVLPGQPSPYIRQTRTDQPAIELVGLWGITIVFGCVCPQPQCNLGLQRPS